MKKYLLGLLAVPIMSPLLSYASASDSYTLNVDPDSLQNESQSYIPGSFTTEGGVVSNLTTVCNTDLLRDSPSDCYGRIHIFDENNDELNYYYSNSPSFELQEGQTLFANGINLPAGTYSVGANFDVAFKSVSFSVGSSSSDSVLPELSVPSSFTSGIIQLVNNFGSTISEWIPVVILVTLGITAIFALFRVVRNYARRSFKG